MGDDHDAAGPDDACEFPPAPLDIRHVRHHTDADQTTEAVVVEPERPLEVGDRRGVVAPGAVGDTERRCRDIDPDELPRVARPPQCLPDQAGAAAGIEHPAR